MADPEFVFCEAPSNWNFGFTAPMQLGQDSLEGREQTPKGDMQIQYRSTMVVSQRFNAHWKLGDGSKSCNGSGATPRRLRFANGYVTTVFGKV